MRAAIYCRVSTLEQTQNLSLETQEKACRAYCLANGYDVDRVFIDAGESAKTTDRPEFTALLSHCRQQKGRLHAVIVYSLTRFSRNSADHDAITTLLRGLGIALRSRHPADRQTRSPLVRPSAKVPPGKRTARPRLQISLEIERKFLVSKRHHYDRAPRLPPTGVRTRPVVVRREPGANILGDASVVLRGI